jgi:pilus assembly protein Flp/PilA
MKNLTDYMLAIYLKVMGVLRSERGQTLVEYALILVLIAIVVWLMVQGTGRSTNSIFSNINSVLSGVPGS